MVVCLHRDRDTESPPRRCKPFPSTSLWPDVHLPNFATIRLCQSVTTSLFTLWVLTLDSWFRHLANPLRRIFQLQSWDFYIAQCLFLSNRSEEHTSELQSHLT